MGLRISKACHAIFITQFLSRNLSRMSAKGKALNNNGYDQKNEPTIFLPSRVHTKPQPKTTIVAR